MIGRTNPGILMEPGNSRRAATTSRGSEHHRLVVEEGEGERLDRFLARRLGFSRSRCVGLIGMGLVRVENRETKKSEAVSAGQVVLVEVPPPEPLEAEAQDIPLDVVFEDEHFLVVNKPAGLVVHPAPGHPNGTLVNALLHHVQDLSGIGGKLRPGIVHRLDRDTSGLLVVAKGDRGAHRPFQCHPEARSSTYLSGGRVGPPSGVPPDGGCPGGKGSQRPEADGRGGGRASRADPNKGQGAVDGRRVPGYFAQDGADSPDPGPPGSSGSPGGWRQGVWAQVGERNGWRVPGLATGTGASSAQAIASFFRPELPPSHFGGGDEISRPAAAGHGFGGALGEGSGRRAGQESVRVMAKLDPTFTFETFVVGPANRLASAAARRAAERPGVSYNPLFIYASSGLGKTHILGAIAHHVAKSGPGQEG